eukprot:scaffold59653_cov57-Phaeocystis_antarctica.AAC.4
MAYDLPEDGGGAAVCKAVRAAKLDFSGAAWRGAAAPLCALVKACLRVAPAKRPTPHEATRHAAFAGAAPAGAAAAAGGGTACSGAAGGGAA